MPITGKESTLTSALNSAIIASIEAQFSGSIGTPEYINALSAGIANALIQFLVSNVEVNAGQTVPATGILDSLGHDCTGDSATSTPGTIS